MQKNTLKLFTSCLIGISTLPFLALFIHTQTLGEFSQAFASIVGLLGGLMFVWQIILGNKLIAKILTPDYMSLIKLHIFLGIYGFFFALVHPILEALAYGKYLGFIFIPNFDTQFENYVTLGRIALYMFILIWLSSLFVKQNVSFRLWRYVHYLSYPMLAFIFIHSIKIGVFINTYLYIKIYWYALLTVFILITFWRVSQTFNIGRKKYLFVRKTRNNRGTTIYTFSPKRSKIVPNVG